jgi:hypothetical protein
VPARAQWTANNPTSPTQGRPLNQQLSPIPGSPPLDTSRDIPSSLNGYLEDTEPRFASPNQRSAQNYSANPQMDAQSAMGPSRAYPTNIPMRTSQTPPPSIAHSSSAIDLRTLPMTFRDDRFRPPGAPGQALEYHASLDSLPLAEGQRSPAALSEVSHYTSVSQRGVNPAWQGRPRRHGPKQSREDVLFDTNPDFQLPSNRGPPRGRGRGRANFAGMGPGRAGSLPGNIGGMGGPPPPPGSQGYMNSPTGAYPMMGGNNGGGGGRYYP